MSNFAVEVKGLSKCYHIGALQNQGVVTFGERVTQAVMSPIRKASGLLRGHATGAADLNEEFWAMQDVSFDVKQGELVGIIGRNGAGKSTLLKMLSRITEPTKGSIKIHGRVGSLLEVGTGFHQELTGRENVFLNGAILGMSRRDIAKNFDEIVAFSEIGKFIDTPVKHYSSGMTLRLAFSVAAHLEPEVLIVDEVLAVGDAKFQRKCIAKMEEVGGEGRTVLFVSHNMPAVTRMCQRVIMLDSGCLVGDGDAHKVVASYMSDGLGTSSERSWEDPSKAPAGDVARLQAVRVRTEEGKVSDVFNIDQPIGVEVDFEVTKSDNVLQPHILIVNDEGVELFVAVDVDPEWRKKTRPKGLYTTTAWIPANFLTEGMCIVTVSMWALEPSRIMQYAERDAVAFQVIDSMDGSNSARGDWAGDFRGIVRPLLKWETQFDTDKQ